MKKNWLSTFTVLALVASLAAGCGQAQNSAPAASQNTENSAATPSDAIEDELVIAANQDMTDLMNDDIFKRFQEKHPGIKLTYVPGNGSETVAKVKAQKDAPQIDVAILEINSQVDGVKNDVWAPITKEDVPNMDKVVYDVKIEGNTGVPVFYSPHVITYNKELVESKGLPVPTSWNDLARPELKGLLALQDPAGSFGRTALIMLAYANGGSESQIDPGFEKLATIAKNQQTFYKNQSFINQALQDKTAAYTVWALNRHHTYRVAGNLPLEFVVPKEGVYVSVSGVACLVKGAKHPNAAKKFIDFMLTDEIQQLLAEKIYLNPVTDVKLNPEVAKLVEFDNSNIKEFDNAVIAQNLPSWLERFNKEITPLVGKDL
jgi:putative spermidine/putrescine transport system substrate-binding protein